MPISNAYQVSQVGLTIRYCQRIRRRINVVPRATVVRVSRVQGDAGLVVFAVVVRPPQASQCITFSQRPLISIFRSPLILYVVYLLIRQVKQPIYFTNPAKLITSPTSVKGHSTRSRHFQVFHFSRFANHLMTMVNFQVSQAHFVHSAMPTVSSIHPIGPRLRRQAMIKSRFISLLVVNLLMSFPPVFNVVTVPKERMGPRLRTILLTNVKRFTGRITLSIFVEQIESVVISHFNQPGTGTIIILDYRSRPFRTNHFSSACPLFTVRIYQVRYFHEYVPVTPFRVVRYIRPRVRRYVVLRFLPFSLLQHQGQRGEYKQLCFLTKGGWPNGRANSWGVLYIRIIVLWVESTNFSLLLFKGLVYVCPFSLSP